MSGQDDASIPIDTVQRENETLESHLEAIRSELEAHPDYNAYDNFSALLYDDAAALDFDECYELDEDKKTGRKILEYVDFSRWDHLRELPQGLFRLTTMRSLHLAGCSSLRSIPPSIQRLDQLSDLDLTRCSSLKRLPNEVTSSLLQLKRLTLSYCEALEELPTTWSGTTRLESLSLEGCRSLKGIPEGLWTGCPNLVYLGLRRLPCLDPCLPPGIAHLSKVKTLNLRDCPNLKYLADNPSRTMASLVHLHSLFLNHTPIKTLPIEAISRLPRIHNVTLEGCSRLPVALRNHNQSIVFLMRLLVHTRSRATLLELALWKAWGWSEDPVERAANRQSCRGINTVVRGVLPFLCGDTAASLFPFYCHGGRGEEGS